MVLPVVASCAAVIGFDTDRALRDAGTNGDERDDVMAEGGTPDAEADAGGAPSVDRRWSSWGISGASFPSNYADYGSDVTDAIFDTETGLGWPVAPAPDPVAWSDAPQVCVELRAGGFADWRLPTRIEQLSIVQYGLYPTASARFQTPSDAFWTASPYADDTSSAWAVNFDMGTVQERPKFELHHVRCVRGGRNDTNGPSERFSRGVGTVFDSVTNLMWQADTVSARTFLDARTYCSRLLINNKNGFRVPLMHELQTLVDERRASPALTPLFGTTGGTEIWSMTNMNNDPSTMLVMNFQDGRNELVAQSKTASVLCVQ
ncbi:hypothetical protein AKJ09_06649 [Labilithrix luteola]|uniref:Lcl C-terminal domain-containing protein n=1 Tax=Labilithrix luteola TaxID=1391654 RepID=A0A0K1Q2E6_9BACT|nr:hypothetical protein AKJ09_06649 [Labilithrix luteola]